MAQQVINVGNTPNDGTGDPLRTAYIKCNQNFSELYNTSIAPTSLSNGTSNIGITGTDGQIYIGVGGTPNIALFTINGQELKGNLDISNGDIDVDGNITINRLTVNTFVMTNLVPFGNNALSLGNATNRWNDLYLSGTTIVLGGLQLKDQGGTLGIYESDGTTPATIQQSSIDTTTIANGTSNVKVLSTDGDISIAVNGVANILVASDSGISVSGTTTVSGNANVGNLGTAGQIAATGNVTGGNIIAANNVSATGNVSGTFLFGDGGFLSNITAISNVAVSQIANGSSVLAVSSAGGNINITVGGVGTATVTDSGANISGYLDATGNITGGNIISAGSLSAASATVSGNSAANNISTSNNLHVQGSTSSISTSTGALRVDGGAGILGTLNVGGNTNVGGSLSVTGNITGAYLIGDGSQITGIDTSFISSGTSGITVLSSGGNIQANVAGVTRALFDTAGLDVTGHVTATTTVTAAGNVTGGNLITSGLVSAGTTVTATGNITGGNLVTSGAVSSASLISSGNILAANINANTNVTATTVTASGNVNSTNLSVTSTASLAVVDATITTISTLANVTATTAATSTTTGSLRTAGGLGVGGNAFVGGLLTVTGNVTGGNLRTTGTANITTGNITTLTGTTFTATGNITGGNIITAGLASVSSITKTGSNGVGNIGSSTSVFNTVFAKATSAQYADLAEKYLADADYEPGTVLSFGGSGEVTICDIDSDPMIAGIVSENPSYLMNSGLQGEHVVNLALIGRVPCRVRGPVRRGQMMVSAGDGYARAEPSPGIGTVIGKALQDFDADQGIIEIVVGRL